MCKTPLRATAVFPEAASTKQKDLHKELSALRVDLENITIAAPGSDISQVQWKVWAQTFIVFRAAWVLLVWGVCCGFPVLPAPVSPHPASLPGRLWGSLPCFAACQLRLGRKEGDDAQFSVSLGATEERLQVWVQSAPLWEQLVREREQHSAPQGARNRWKMSVWFLHGWSQNSGSK